MTACECLLFLLLRKERAGRRFARVCAGGWRPRHSVLMPRLRGRGVGVLAAAHARGAEAHPGRGDGAERAAVFFPTTLSLTRTRTHPNHLPTAAKWAPPTVADTKAKFTQAYRKVSGVCVSGF